MGIGGRDYSHRSGQRSSLRELGEVERGQRRSGVGHGPCVAQASGGLGHPRWIRSLALFRRRPSQSSEQHHLPAEQTPEHRRIAKRPRQTLASRLLASTQGEVARAQRLKATVNRFLSGSEGSSTDRCHLLSVSCKAL